MIEFNFLVPICLDIQLLLVRLILCLPVKGHCCGKSLLLAWLMDLGQKTNFWVAGNTFHVVMKAAAEKNLLTVKDTWSFFYVFWNYYFFVLIFFLKYYFLLMSLPCLISSGNSLKFHKIKITYDILLQNKMIESFKRVKNSWNL